MKVKGFKGEFAQINTSTTSYGLKSEANCRSKIQYVCGQALKECFKFDPILEEVPIPGLGLFLDFFIPSRKIAFEIRGRQHDEYVPYFHKSQKGFRASKDRDDLKSRWCDLNNITLYQITSPEEIKELYGN